MKIEKIKISKYFSDVEVGDAFTMVGGDCTYLRIEVDNQLTTSGEHDGLAVNLCTGSVTWFDDTDEVIILTNAKVVR